MLKLKISHFLRVRIINTKTMLYLIVWTLNSTEIIFKICDNIQFKVYNSIFNVIVNRTLWIMFSSLNFISAIQSPSLAWMIQCLSILRQNVSKIIHTVQLKVLCHEMFQFISHMSIPSGLLIFKQKRILHTCSNSQF